MASQQVTLTPVEDQARVELNQFGIAMIHSLSQYPGGQPGALPAVKDFQHIWNQDKVEIQSILTKVGSSVKWWKLTEDGLWGKNTAAAMGICCLLPGTPAPPLKSSGIAAWYAANQSVIDQAMMPTTVPAQVVTDAIKPPLATTPVAQQQTTQTAVATAQDGTSVVTQMATSTPTTTSAPAKRPAKREVQSTMVPDSAKKDITAAGATETQPIDVDFETGSAIIAAPTRSRVPWIAAGVGAVLLGGALWYMGGSRRRRA